MTAPTTVDAPYSTPGIFSPRYRTATSGILLVITLIAFEGMSIGAAMPAISKDLQAIDLYGWSFSAFLMAGLFVTVMAGQWSDRRGHALPFLLGVAVFVAGMIIAGAAVNKGMFIAARAVQGFGGGAVIVASYVMIARVYRPDARPKIFAALSSAWVVPALIGPSVGGLVAGTVGWRWVFYGIVPLVIPALLMLLPALRAKDEPKAAAGDAVRRAGPVAMTLAAAGAAVGAGVLLYGVGVLHRQPPIGLAACAAGLLLLGLSLPRLLPAGSLRLRRGLPTTVVMRGLLSGPFFCVNSFIPLMLQEVRDFSDTAAGVALTTGALGWSAGAYLQSRGVVRRERLIMFGAVAVTAGILLTALAVIPAVPGWIAVPAWVVAGLGMGMGISSVNVTTMAQSSDAEQGANSASLQVTDTLGASLAIGFGGALINFVGHDDIATGFVAISLVMAVLGTFAAIVAGRVRVRT
ncbi:MFS transporter [Spongiactinospora gelatinilytica]|uniref:MFS transporter n=1 Tax=Spongiactinospora gelatinilytica TaxID=2666298 RepID=A0A2W2HB59_9ACTN|nr:MFS transporter [Spongiactinospora gelatinilytica]PZG52149.1 MFS transporter [Spongiactinospora gelatinilytica]